MGAWSQALQMAAQTPPERNRYVDFLRAVSILVVVTGHWLIAGFYYADGAVGISRVLETQPRTQWLTWIFQVMPIFFIVGGYANAVSLESAARRGLGYAEWLASRLNRLVTPLLALIVGWAALALALQFSPVAGAVIQAGSRAALIPIWFLAIYVIVVVLAPVTHRLWVRWGFLSFWAFVGFAAVVDFVFFFADLRLAGWSNYFWVWLAVHQLGYAWRAGRFDSAARLLAGSAVAFGILYALIIKGPYPLAMVGSPDAGLSNTLPPKITLVVLAIIQLGLLLAAEGPMRRFLGNQKAWAATVLVNSMIMTLYLWHLTVMVLVVALAWLIGGAGLALVPGTAEWWYTRPLWIAFLYAVLLPVAALLSRFERIPRPADAPVPAAARQVGGAVMLCLGVALLARFGFGTTPIPGLDIAAFLAVVGGAGLSGLLPRFGRSP